MADTALWLSIRICFKRKLRPQLKEHCQEIKLSITRVLGAALIASLIIIPAYAQENPILQRLEAFTKAYNAGDAARVSEFYIEKGALLPPQSNALVGRKPIAAHYAKAFANGVTNLTLRVLEIDQVAPETAVVIGETQVKVGAQTVHGRFLHVWKKANDTWSISRDIYHVLGTAK